MKELSFLLKLLLNYKLSKEVKDLIAERINEIDEGIKLSVKPHPAMGGVTQAASTMALMEKHGIDEGPVQPAEIAQTPAAQAALVHRAELMNSPRITDKATGRPRKW